MLIITHHMTDFYYYIMFSGSPSICTSHSLKYGFSRASWGNFFISFGLDAWTDASRMRSNGLFLVKGQGHCEGFGLVNATSQEDLEGISNLVQSFIWIHRLNWLNPCGQRYKVKATVTSFSYEHKKSRVREFKFQEFQVIFVTSNLSILWWVHNKGVQPLITQQQ